MENSGSLKSSVCGLGGKTHTLLRSVSDTLSAIFKNLLLLFISIIAYLEL